MALSYADPLAGRGEGQEIAETPHPGDDSGAAGWPGVDPAQAIDPIRQSHPVPIILHIQEIPAPRALRKNLENVEFGGADGIYAALQGDGHDCLPKERFPRKRR